LAPPPPILSSSSPPPTPAPPSLLAYGAGGELGEDVTARVLKQARSLVNQHQGGLLCVVANMVNVCAKDDGFARRACEWLMHESSQQARERQTQDENSRFFDVASVLVFGELWPTETYAKLVTCVGKISHSATDEEEYVAFAARLHASGVKDVCNGILLASIVPALSLIAAADRRLEESEDACMQIATSAFSSLPLVLTAVAAESGEEEANKIVFFADCALVHLRLIRGPKQLWQDLAASKKYLIDI